MRNTKNPFKKKKEQREFSLEDFFASNTTITKSEALTIPAITACVNFITGIISGLPINLYQRKTDGSTNIIADDTRVNLLNGSTGDTLNSYQMRKAIITDYLLNGRGVMYINRKRGKVQSLNYVDSDYISVNKNQNPIFKNYEIMINGSKYRDFEFVKMVRNTTDGITGEGILTQFKELFAVVYNMYNMQKNLYAHNGLKGGFINLPEVKEKEARREIMKNLKNGFEKLQNGELSIISMTNDSKFTPVQNTVDELNFTDSKNSFLDDICRMFNLNADVIGGKASEEQFQNAVKIAVMPIISAFEKALNNDLLLTKEQAEHFYFAFDTTELLRASIEKRYNAYDTAIKGGWMTPNEARQKEDLQSLNGLDVICGNLGNVYINPTTGDVYTPNTDTVNNTITSDNKGGEEI